MLSSAAAAALDAALFSISSLPVLMELAGESVAFAISATFPPQTHPRIVCVCGPGNNGGDGFVAARHLTALGYSVRVLAPVLPSASRADTDAARVWAAQRASLSAWDIPLLADASLPDADVYVDAILGFSGSGAPRAPFDALICELAAPARASRTVSVDVPSGWPVDGAEPPSGALHPAVLVSLTAPKLCSRHFRGAHWLGLAAVPPALLRAHGLDPALFRGACSPAVRLA